MQYSNFNFKTVSISYTKKSDSRMIKYFDFILRSFNNESTALIMAEKPLIVNYCKHFFFNF